jgi:hypothetical protein
MHKDETTVLAKLISPSHSQQSSPTIHQARLIAFVLWNFGVQVLLCVLLLK